MKTYHRTFTYILVAALLAGPISVGSAAGLLGRRCLSAFVDRKHPANFELNDPWGASARYNQPIMQGFDLSLDASFLFAGSDFVNDGEEVSISVQDLLLSGTYHAAVRTSKFFVSAGVGRTRVEINNDSRSQGTYLIAAGFEVPLGRKFALTPFVQWKDSFESENILSDSLEGAVEFNALGEFELSTAWSLLTRVRTDDEGGWGASAGFAARF